MLVPVALWTEGFRPVLGSQQDVLLANLVLIGTALAYLVWFRAVEQVSPVQTSLLARLSPATAIIIDFLMGRTLGSLQWLGLGIIVASLLLERQATPSASRQVLSR